MSLAPCYTREAEYPTTFLDLNRQYYIIYIYITARCLLPCYRHHGASFPKILDGVRASSQGEVRHDGKTDSRGNSFCCTFSACGLWCLLLVHQEWALVLVDFSAMVWASHQTQVLWTHVGVYFNRGTLHQWVVVNVLLPGSPTGVSLFPYTPTSRGF